ncbi:hypothetical protein H5410_035876 [Solanum commersonii]|uniref:Uncharacterized protein n=1 Tax=Solanum commersonii TaxID=4109 RepID=A0A9J5Y5Z1_SOLCO|nr:hypothetical protein H5410_035876 [Solanum commersonii]
MDLGGNICPPVTQPPTKSSAQWKDPLNVGKYDELHRLIIIPNRLGLYPSIQSVKAIVESMCSFYHGAWRYWKEVELFDLVCPKHDKRPSWIHEDIWKKLNEYWASPEVKKKHTMEKKAQTSILPRSPQPSDKEE